MKEFFTYIKSKTFFKNVGFALSIVMGALIVLLIFLRIYTHHNKAIAVPDFSDFPVEIASDLVKERHLRFEIFDSIYVSDRESGVVIDQHPAPGALVKKNRKVYFTINANSPEKILMPDLVGITLREARTKITVAGLKLGKLRYRYDMAKNVVLDQETQGHKIEAGDTLLKGSSIDLVLGKGLSNEKSVVPNLIGLSFEEAQDRASDAFFTTSDAIPDLSVGENDTLVAFIYRQHPRSSEGILVPLGTQITIWVTIDSTKLPGYAAADTSDYILDGYYDDEDVENIEDPDYDLDLSQ